MNYEHSFKSKSDSTEETTKVSYMNSDKKVYKRDARFSSFLKSELVSKDINVESDRELVKLEEHANIAHFSDSQGKIHSKSYDAIVVDQPMQQNELVKDLLTKCTLDQAKLKVKEKEGVYLAGHCLVPFFGPITEESIRTQARVIANQILSRDSKESAKYTHVSIPFILEGSGVVREYMLNDRGKLDFVLGKSWLRFWTLGGYWRQFWRYPFMLYGFRKPFSAGYGYI